MNQSIVILFRTNFSGYYAAPDDKQPHPGIILIHEVWGLTEHIKDVANRFVKEGYVVLAPDLLSETGITEKVDQTILAEVKNPATRDEAQKKLRAAMAPIMSPEFAVITTEKLKACVDYLIDDPNVSGKVGVIGFCFGGTYAYVLACEDDRLQAAVPFYGHSPEPLDTVRNITSPVLAFYGEQDKNLVDSLPQLEAKMKEYHIDFTDKVYTNTGHAFFNDTNPTTYNKEASEDAYKKTLEFLKSNIS